MKLISQKDARTAGLPRYFTGKPCKHNHVEERYTANSMCVSCAYEKAVLWKAKNPAKAKEISRRAGAKQKEKNPAKLKLNARRFALKRHELSINDYYDILADQGGGCAICGAKPDPTPLSLSVDHDHSHCAGEYGCEICVRGLLCSVCNSSLGGFRDSIERLRKAISYLRSWKERRT